MGDWPKLQNTLAFTDSLGIFGTRADGGGSPNSKGSYVEMTPALPYDISGIYFSLQNQPSQYQCLDVAIGGSGSEVIVAPDLLASASLSGTHADMAFFLPLSLPKGTRIAVRSQGSGGSGFMTVKGFFLADGFAGLQGPTRWSSWGFQSGTTNGTQFTTGNGSKGSWTQLVAATDITTRWFIVEITGDTSPVDMAIDIGVGAAASEIVIIPDIHYTVESLGLFVGPFPFTIPKGTRIAVRGRASGGTCRAALHGGA